MSLQKGLVGHWTMDSRDTDNGVIRDRSGFENHGTINGASFNTPGKLGEAGVFNGTNNFIEIEKLSGTDISGANGNTTISYWFRAENVSDRGEIVSRYQPERGITSSVQDGVHNTVTGDSGGNNNITIAVDSGEWYHHVLSYNNSTNDNAVYINGSQYGSFTQNFNTSTEDGFYIGDDSFDNNFHFDGLIDDVRIYKRALSDEEINALYQQRNVQQTSSRGFPVAAGNLVARYPFRDGSARDDARNANYADPTAYDGTVNGPTFRPQAGVQGGGAFDFDGTDDSINVNSLDLSNVSNAYTITFWEKRNGQNGSGRSFDWAESIGNSARSSGLLHFHYDGDYINITTPYRTGFVHYAYTHNGSNEWSVYENGSLAQKKSAGTAVSEESYELNFGFLEKANGQFYDGILKDFRVYNINLSDSQINQIYQNTRPQISASGGSTITTETINGEQYRIHAFENVGTSTFEVSDAQANATVDVLVVGGGGGGGDNSNENTRTQAGGGGAGGVVFEQEVSVSQSNFTINVGDGGSGSTSEQGNDGNNSTAFGLTALGGGGGGIRGNVLSRALSDGRDGGSGGGAGFDASGGSGLQPTSTDGGSGKDGGGDGDGSGGGGGGAIQEGFYGGTDNNTGGDGGDGIDFSAEFGSTFGENGVFAGGGGGGGVDSNSNGNGGIGGGGTGGLPNGSGENGSPNTGGGGGGSSDDSSISGGDGGSGIVLIRYKL